MKHKVKINRLFTLFSLLLALILVACGSSGSPSGSQTEPGVDATATDFLDIEETAIVETPLVTEVIEETPVVTEEMEETPTVAATEAPTEVPTEEPTATEIVSPTVEAVETPLTEAVITDTITTTLVTQAILASDLVGMDITNEASEQVGEVSELLVDTDGSLQHLLFDVGGFLGIGEKTVAVASDQFEVRHQDGTVDPEVDFDVSDLTVFYSGSTAELEDLPAFDASLLEADGSVIHEPETENADADPNFDPALYTGQLQVSEFQDYNLLNMADEDIGEVEDLIIDLAENKVTYAVVDVGGFLGVAENSVAVPWDQFTIETEGETEVFRIDTDVTTLESAPTFDRNSWVYPIDLDWDADAHSYWDMH